MTHPSKQHLDRSAVFELPIH